MAPINEGSAVFPAPYTTSDHVSTAGSVTITGFWTLHLPVGQMEEAQVHCVDPIPKRRDKTVLQVPVLLTDTQYPYCPQKPERLLGPAALEMLCILLISCCNIPPSLSKQSLTDWLSYFSFIKYVGWHWSFPSESTLHKAFLTFESLYTWNVESLNHPNSHSY